MLAVCHVLTFAPSMPLLRVCIAAFLPSLLAPTYPAGAQAVDNPGNTPPPLPVTVTPEMGDKGGKIFGQVPDPAKTRHYYIAVEPELWNFAPEGVDPVCGKAFP